MPLCGCLDLVPRHYRPDRDVNAAAASDRALQRLIVLVVADDSNDSRRAKSSDVAQLAHSDHSSGLFGLSRLHCFRSGVTAVSRIRGTEKDTRGHQRTRTLAKLSTGGRRRN